MTPTLRTGLFATLALVGFAGNSLLCRLALRAQEIDAASFTMLRLLSGGLVLSLLAGAKRRTIPRQKALVSGVVLLGYAAPFSYAYLRLGTGTGALILFASVQLSMLIGSLRRREQSGPALWLGFALGMSGLLGLTAPGLSAPEPLSALSMVVAGASWGVYSLRRPAAAEDPLALTAANFSWAAALWTPLWAATSLLADTHVSTRGVTLALTSGAIASGLGYSLWYAALRALPANLAAILQLLVPVLAAALGAWWLSETVTLRLTLSASAILGGVAIALQHRRNDAKQG